jgi:hypothetical protein
MISLLGAVVAMFFEGFMIAFSRLTLWDRAPAEPDARLDSAENIEKNCCFETAIETNVKEETNESEKNNNHERQNLPVSLGMFPDADVPVCV